MSSKQGAAYEAWPHTGAVLIGGAGSRMAALNMPKHEIVLSDGRTMFEHVASTLSDMCRQVVSVGSARARQDHGYKHIEDLRRHAGPLAGIEALLASDIDTEFLVCPCDMPKLTTEALSLLLTSSDAPATIVQLEGRPEPESLPARISIAALPTVRALLNNGQRAVWTLMQILPAETVTISESWARCFANINTPVDLQQL